MEIAHNNNRSARAVFAASTLLSLTIALGCGSSEQSPAAVDDDEQSQESGAGDGNQDAAADEEPDARAESPRNERDGATAPSQRPSLDGSVPPRAGSSATSDAGMSGASKDAAPSRPADDDAGTSADAGSTPAAGPVLPPTTDPAAPGPFMVDVVATAPGLSSHMLYVPRELGKNGIKHPIVVWTNGNGASSSFYDPFLKQIASHGFFLVVDKRSTSMRETEYAEQKQGIDWAEKQAKDADGPYAGKLDGGHIALMGHSMGSLSSFVNGGDPRVTTTIHWSGGLVGNPTGTNEDALQKLHAPAAFLCGGADSQAGPACANDFRDAPKSLSVFYGTLAGVSHLGVFGDRNGGEYGRMGVAWLRWKLAADDTMRDFFVGSSCKACTRPWTGMSRNLD